MSHTFLAPSFYVIDTHAILEEYHSDHLFTQMYPQLTLHGFIALVLSIPNGPRFSEDLTMQLEKILGLRFDILGDLQSIEQAAYFICEQIDIQTRGISSNQNHSVAYFWKWLDSRSLVMAHHNDPSVLQQIQRQSKNAVEAYVDEQQRFVAPL